jgi:tryptophan synthase alpha chain
MTGTAPPATGTAVGSLEAVFRARRAAGRKLLVPYLMGGMDDDWVAVLQALVAAGADAVEVGIPFSDPMIDGPVIQEASVRALARGTTPQAVVDGVARAAVGVPVVVMTYYNLVYRAGHHRMARQLAAAGITGTILPDLPLEELGPWAEEADAAGVATVLLVAPSTPEERVRRICDRCRGFVYAVARMGVTGEQAALGSDAAAVVGRVRAATDLPVCIGVGISTPGQAVEACRVADGAVVGSALVRRLLDGGGAEAAAAFVGELRAAIDGSGG